MTKFVEIFHGGRIWVGKGQVTSAFACSDGHVVAAGDLDSLRVRYSGATVTELPGPFTMPGLNDAHAHPGLLSLRGHAADVSPASVADNHHVLKVIDGLIKAAPPGAWVMASGYDPDVIGDGSRVTRAQIDRVSPANPVVVFDRSCHWGVLNSAALNRVGLDDESQPPSGGAYGRAESGALDGSVWERAFFQLAYDSVGGASTALPLPSVGEAAAGLASVQQKMIAAGYTSVTDALVGPTEVAAYHELERKGGLLMRINVLAAYETHESTIRQVAQAETTSRVRVAGVKIFVDGAVSGGTCLLSDPIPGRQVFEHYSVAELAEIVNSIHQAGGRVAAHANGDVAIRRFLSALERVDGDVKSRRHRIEHCSVVDLSLVEKMATLGVVAVPFGNYASFHGAKMLDWYGQDRAERMFAHRWLLDGGVPVAGSSDYPCGPYDFGLALHSCVLRQTDSGVFGPSQAITPEETLHLYTYGSAFASGDEGEQGTLMPGQLADFVVLDRDPMEIDSHLLSGTEVLSTYVGGVPAYSA